MQIRPTPFIARRAPPGGETRKRQRPDGPAALAHQWRDRAATLREYGAAAQAEVLERCATELEEGVRQWRDEPLTLAEAAAETGYSTDHLGRLVREGKLPNAGRPGAPASPAAT